MSRDYVNVEQFPGYEVLNERQIFDLIQDAEDRQQENNEEIQRLQLINESLNTRKKKCDLEFDRRQMDRQEKAEQEKANSGEEAGGE